MHKVVTLKVWSEPVDKVMSKYYRVQNSEEVIEMDIASGDILNIDGIGRLEILSVRYAESDEERNPYMALELTCGLFPLRVKN